LNGIPSSVVSATYVVAQPASATTLTATPSPLVLPGSLQETSVVNQTAAGGAMPTGNVNFYYDSSNLLGTAPLKMVPSTQAFTNTVMQSTPIANPVGIAAVTLSTGAQPVIVSAISVNGSSTASVALYKPSSSGTSFNAYSYFNGNQTVGDAIAAGYFLKTKSTGNQSFVMHESGQYLVFDGSTTSTNGILALNQWRASSFAGCDCSNPDTESISIDDFDNDGYSDVGTLVSSYSYQGVVTPGVAGVALNAGTSNPGNFGTFIQAFPPSSVTSPSLFCPIAITTGHFTAAAGAQLAVLATTPTDNCGDVSSPGTIFLYALSTDKTSLVPVGTPLALPDANATSLAAADLNNDGKSDLIVGETFHGELSTTGGLRSVFSNGDGTFQTPSSLNYVGGAPTQFSFSDFNADGYLDIAFTEPAGFGVLLNDGTGNIQNFTARAFTFSPATTTVPGGITSADLNGDGLPDLVTAIGNGSATANSNIEFLLNSSASQAVLTTGSKTIPSGAHTLTATYSGDANFASSSSSGLAETVNQTVPTVIWAGPGSALEYGTPLTTAQLNATASVPGVFVYNPSFQAVLPPGADTVTAAFTPTDNFDYSTVASSLVINVGSPTLASIVPTSAIPGSANTSITITGAGFVTGAVASFNGAALATTYVDQNHLTAIVPASLLLKPLSATVTVSDPGGISVSGSQPFAVVASPPTATVSAADATITAGQQSTVTLSVNPYPLAITATATLTFTPAAPITTQDPSVLFSNNLTTISATITPASAATSTPFAFQSGSTAGTITVTIHLTLASGQDVTPSNIAAVTVSVPASPPVLSSPTLTRSGQSIQVSVIGLSSTRDMTEAQFHFTAASGKSIKTTDVTVPLTNVFQTWYASPTSDQFGTNFMYTQPFTLDGSASDIASVTITLANSNGASSPVTAQ
jgi:hypothetical protein